MKLEYDGSYPYDNYEVMEWWYGSDHFYELISEAFQDQVDTFLSEPGDLPVNIREAISLLIDYYEDKHLGSIFAGYHAEKLALLESERFG